MSNSKIISFPNISNFTLTRISDPSKDKPYLFQLTWVIRLKLNRKQIIAIKTKYPNSLALSKQNKAHLAVHERSGDLMVVGSNGNSDFPIHYGNGKMGYDHIHPKFIHTEIKKLHKL